MIVCLIIHLDWQDQLAKAHIDGAKFHIFFQERIFVFWKENSCYLERARDKRKRVNLPNQRIGYSSFETN
jgi:hypothetical protein